MHQFYNGNLVMLLCSLFCDEVGLVGKLMQIHRCPAAGLYRHLLTLLRFGDRVNNLSVFTVGLQNIFFIFLQS